MGQIEVFKPDSKIVLETSQFSPFHLCKLDIQVLLGKILSATNRKHMCREYSGERVQEHVILGETLFMWSCQRYQDFWLLAMYVLTGQFSTHHCASKSSSKMSLSLMIFIRDFCSCLSQIFMLIVRHSKCLFWKIQCKWAFRRPKAEPQLHCETLSPNLSRVLIPVLSASENSNWRVWEFCWAHGRTELWALNPRQSSPTRRTTQTQCSKSQK